MSDITFDISQNSMEVHRKTAEPWKVTLVDTGDKTMTGGRLKRVKNYLDPKEPFCFTYGDGLSDIDISKTIEFHKEKGKLATVTAVQPPGRYGALECNGDIVKGFTEKPKGDGGRINGGFFVLNPEVIDLIEGDNTSWEEKPLNNLASSDQMVAFNHDGFWQPMDTLRDRQHLEELWSSNKAPWKIWK
jgi:glucose-1-phosphate cytidylyltransferase